ncbi:MAG TPA: hypothetical protein VF856_11950 [Gemmatimonadaceae bacterium]
MSNESSATSRLDLPPDALSSGEEFSVDANTISGVMMTIDETNHPGNARADSFSYTAQALTVPADKVVSL